MGGRIKFSASDVQDITDSFLGGEPYHKIAARHNCDASVITNRVKEWGLIRPNFFGHIPSDGEWRDIDGYNGHYQVSTHGLVRSAARINCSGQVISARFMHQSTDQSGYKLVNLSCGGLSKTFKVHRLVAAAFLPNPQNLPQINHKDGVKSNNEVTNLEWISALNNQLHAIAVGLKTSDSTRGELFYDAKLTNQDVLEIRRLRFEEKMMQRKIADLFNISREHVRDICLFKRWKHI